MDARPVAAEWGAMGVPDLARLAVDRGRAVLSDVPDATR